MEPFWTFIVNSNELKLKNKIGRLDITTNEKSLDWCNNVLEKITEYSDA